ncbi:signal recognition particle subunit srp68 [Coemansia sp. RSA 552]|nr:signal recognition particle subunit srp68 [Coemansia sp. RSA 552]
MAARFDVWGYAMKARKEHGERAQEYARYRRHCARHLHTVRRAVRRGGSGTGSTPEDPATAVEIQLLVAERAWAYAMELREQHARTEEPRQRAHAERRLRAAVKAAQQMAATAAGCDACTELAAQAYVQWMQSQLCFEEQMWQAALDSAQLARAAAARVGAEGHLVEQLEPIERLTAHRLGARTGAGIEAQLEADAERAAAVGYANVAAAVARAGESATTVVAAGESVLQWRGRTVAMSDAQLAALASAAEQHLGAGDSRQAVAAFRKLAQQQQQRDSSGNNAVVQLYGACARAALAVDGHAQARAAALGAALGAEDVLGVVGADADAQARLTRVVAGYAKARRTLQNVARVANAISTQDTALDLAALDIAREVSQDVAAADAYYTCMQNYYAAVALAASDGGNRLDALALLDSVRKDAPEAAALLKRARRSIEAPSPVDELWSRAVAVAPDAAERVGAAAQNAEAAARALAGGGGSVSVERIRLDQGLPPVALEPVPVKPLFYDLAAARIDFDMDAINARAGTNSKLKSLIGSLWG